MNRCLSLPDYSPASPSRFHHSFTIKTPISSIPRLSPADMSHFLHLSKQSSQQSLLLPIVPTLLYDPVASEYTCLYSNAEGKLDSISGLAAWDHFFVPSDPALGASFLYRSESRSESTQNRQHVEQLAKITEKPFIIQRSDSEIKAKYRVLWMKTGKFDVDIEVAGRWKSCDVLSESHAKSEYLHDLRVFHHAGQLKKSSFSQFSPFPSVLSAALHQRSSHISVQSLHTPKTSQLLKPSPTAINKFTAIKEKLEIKAIIDAVLDCFSTEAPLSSVIISLLETKLEQWFLSDVSNVVLDRIPTTVRTGSPQPIANPTLIRKSKSHLTAICRSIPKLPFIDMREIHSKCIGMYSAYCSPAKLAPLESPLSLDTNSDEIMLKTASQKLEAVLETVETAKNQSQQEEKYQLTTTAEPLLIPSAVRAAYTQCEKDPALERFFQFGSRDSLESFTERFTEVVTAPINFRMAAKLHAAHQHLHISEDDFDLFIHHFCSSLASLCTDPDTVSTFRRRIEWYRSSVTFPSPSH